MSMLWQEILLENITMTIFENPEVAAAFHVAYHAHQGQKRWDGTPYIEHPISVCKSVEGTDAKIVALLHDVVEDTDLTLDDLSQFGEEIVGAIEAITKRDGEKYVEYLNRVAENRLATKVKLADIEHNLSDNPGKMSKSMRDKYELAIEYLIIKREGNV